MHGKTILTSTRQEFNQLWMFRHVFDCIINLVTDVRDEFVPVLANHPSADQPLLQLSGMDINGNVRFLKEQVKRGVTEIFTIHQTESIRTEST